MRAKGKEKGTAIGKDNYSISALVLLENGEQEAQLWAYSFPISNVHFRLVAWLVRIICLCCHCLRCFLI